MRFICVDTEFLGQCLKCKTEKLSHLLCTRLVEVIEVAITEGKEWKGDDCVRLGVSFALNEYKESPHTEPLFDNDDEDDGSKHHSNDYDG